MRSNISFYFILLCFSGFLPGCESGTYVPSSGVMPTNYSPPDFTSVEGELQRATVYCEGGACRSNVGVIVARHSEAPNSVSSLSQCTGFLVADNIVATNSHCIPAGLKASPSTCSNDLAIRFLGAGEVKKNIFRCVRLIHFSNQKTPWQQDLAYFEIAPTGLTPLKISKAGVSDGETVTVAKMTPLSSFYTGAKMQSSSCTVVLNTLLNMNATNSMAETLTAFDCSAVNGNSGSPVLNQQGEVVGVAQANVTNGYREFIRGGFGPYTTNIPDIESIPHVVFTNFACIADPVAGPIDQQSCEAVKDLHLSDCASFDTETTRRNAEEPYVRWIKSLPNVFVYGITLEVATGLRTANPICVKDSVQMSKEDQALFEKKGLYGFRKDAIELTYQTSLGLKPKFTIDSRYRLSGDVEMQLFGESFFSIELVREKKIWVGTRSSTLRNELLDLDFTKLRIPTRLPTCSDAQVRAGNIEDVRTADGETYAQKVYLSREAAKKKTCPGVAKHEG